MRPTKVIFDTDPGIDDAMALLYLHRSPEIELVGITTVLGNGSVETTTRNALYLRQRFGITAPVAKGAAAPLNGVIDPALERTTLLLSTLSTPVPVSLSPSTKLPVRSSCDPLPRSTVSQLA